MIHEHDWVDVTGLMCHRCLYQRCEICGALRRVKGCRFHNRDDKHYNEKEYYAASLQDGILNSRQYIQELGEPRLGSGQTVLEIGSGLGQYSPLFLRNSRSYRAIEMSRFGAEYARKTFDVEVINDRAGKAWPGIGFHDLIFSAHWLEHMRDADVWFERIAEKCDEFFLILPEGTDTANQDHWWYFFQDTLRCWIEEVGFVGFIRRAKLVELEAFLYVRAWRKK